MLTKQKITAILKLRLKWKGVENKMKITLKAARVNANLTQQEAAKKLNISKDTLANWEKGKTFPDAEGILNIEKIYNIPYDNIIFLPRNYT